MSKLLVTRPKHDKATEYLFAWSIEVIEAAKERGWKVSDVSEKNVNKREVCSRLGKTSPDLVFFNGHGNESEMFGHNFEVVLDGDSSHLLKNSVTFARSCSCLVALGSTAIENGCKAFIGYSDNFWVPMIAKYESTPLRDSVAKPVLEVSNTIPLSLIKNSSVSDAISTARTRASKHILKLVLSKEPHNRAALKALIQNDDCLGFKGNGEAKIS